MAPSELQWIVHKHLAVQQITRELHDPILQSLEPAPIMQSSGTRQIGSLSCFMARDLSGLHDPLALAMGRLGLREACRQFALRTGRTKFVMRTTSP